LPPDRTTNTHRQVQSPALPSKWSRSTPSSASRLAPTTSVASIEFSPFSALPSLRTSPHLRSIDAQWLTVCVSQLAMGVLGSMFGGAYLAIGGSKAAPAAPPINASTPDEADFIKCAPPSQAPVRSAYVSDTPTGSSWTRQRRIRRRRPRHRSRLSLLGDGVRRREGFLPPCTCIAGVQWEHDCFGPGVLKERTTISASPASVPPSSMCALLTFSL
jgi:hypothetical protein